MGGGEEKKKRDGFSTAAGDKLCGCVVFGREASVCLLHLSGSKGETR